MRCRHLKSTIVWVLVYLLRGVFLLVLTLSFLPIDGARADTVIRIVETWPSGNYVTLGKNQKFYLRLAYETDKPVHIWARPYFNGKPANVGSNPSQRYSGKGETFGWFFFTRPGDVVDEIRITAGDGSDSDTSVVAVWRGDIIGGSDVGARQPQPAWIAEMSTRVKAAQDEAYRDRMREPTSPSDRFLVVTFVYVALATGVLGFFLPAWGVWLWQGAWRVAAAIPAAMMTFVVLRIVFDGLRDSTSHNLLPFEILLWGSLSAGMMVLLYIARKLFDKRQ